jgi:hypothetical protein
MVTFEQAFYMPGQGFEVLKYLHYHEAIVLKGVSKYCRDSVTKFADRLVHVFSYNGGTLTFNKNNTIKTYKNCMSVGIKKKSNNYTLVIENYVYYKSRYINDTSDDEYGDYIEPRYEIETTKLKISERSAKIYIQAIKFLAHTIQKRCHQFDFYEIKLDFQPLPEIESEEEEQDDYPGYAEDDFDDYPVQDHYFFYDHSEDYDLNNQYYNPYYDPSDPYYQSEQYTIDYNNHSKKTILVMSELGDFFMNKLFD